MAELKSLKTKNKTFVFESFGNQEADNPAKIIFSRFPFLHELYFKTGDVALDFDDKEKMTKSIMENFSNQGIDHQRFFAECVERIEDLSYNGMKIKTPAEFFEFIPTEAAYAIALEAYTYAKESDTFTMEEKKS